MTIAKTSATYIYSKDCKTAIYLEYLIDKVRKTEGVNFIPICIEDYKTSAAHMKKLSEDLAKKVEAKDFDKALDAREKLTRHELAKKFSALSPMFVLNSEDEQELIVSGSKKSLSRILDVVTKVTDAAAFFHTVDLSGLDVVVRDIATAAITAMQQQQNKVTEQGLETIAE